MVCLTLLVQSLRPLRNIGVTWHNPKSSIPKKHFILGIWFWKTVSNGYQKLDSWIPLGSAWETLFRIHYPLQIKYKEICSASVAGQICREMQIKTKISYLSPLTCDDGHTPKYQVNAHFLGPWDIETLGGLVFWAHFQVVMYYLVVNT